MIKINHPDLKAVHTALFNFSKKTGVQLVKYHLYDLSRPDFETAAWPGCGIHNVVYVVFDKKGENLFVGTNDLNYQGINKYFGVDEEGKCLPKGDWKKEPAYIFFIGVSEGQETKEEREIRYRLREVLQQVHVDIKEWYSSLRQLWLSVSPDKILAAYPWLQGSRQMKAISHLWKLMTSDELVTLMNTGQYYLLAEGLDMGMEGVPALDVNLKVCNTMHEEDILPVDSRLKDFSWLMNLRIYRQSENIGEMQVILHLLEVWFGLKLNPDED